MKTTFTTTHLEQYPRISPSAVRQSCAVRQYYARFTASEFNHNPSADGTSEQRGLTFGNLVSVNIYQNNISELAYFLRIIKTLSIQNQWITIISPPPSFNLSLLTKAGVKPQKIRIARVTASHDAAALMKKALQSNTSAAVISFGVISKFSNVAYETGFNSTPIFVIHGLPEQLH